MRVCGAPLPPPLTVCVPCWKSEFEPWINKMPTITAERIGELRYTKRERDVARFLAITETDPFRQVEIIKLAGDVVFEDLPIREILRLDRILSRRERMGEPWMG
jgi:hypothetical protein